MASLGRPLFTHQIIMVLKYVCKNSFDDVCEIIINKNQIKLLATGWPTNTTQGSTWEIHTDIHNTTQGQTFILEGIIYFH